MQLAIARDKNPTNAEIGEVSAEIAPKRDAAMAAAPKELKSGNVAKARARTDALKKAGQCPATMALCK
jgi:hypothetical protein